MFFTNGTENEIGILLRHIFKLGLGTIEKTFQSIHRANSDFGLPHMITGTTQILLHAKGHLDTHLLVWLQYIVENIFHRLEKKKRAYHEK